jgi:hypothetical protein
MERTVFAQSADCYIAIVYAHHLSTSICKEERCFAKSAANIQEPAVGDITAKVFKGGG